MPENSLHYASAPHRRSPAFLLLRRIIRPCLFVCGLSLIVAAPVLWISYPWIFYGSRQNYQHRRMLTFELPPDRVVYEEDPARASTLLALPADPNTAYPGEQSSLPARGHGDYRNFDGSAEYVPRFHEWFFANITTPPGLVFLHQRTSASGSRRLVMVTAGRTILYDPVPLKGAVATRTGLTLTGWSRAASSPFNLLHGNRKSGINLSLGAKQVARLYAGQPDANDPARLTIKYEIDNAPGTIEGRLNADDTITLQVLDGPALTTWKPTPP